MKFEFEIKDGEFHRIVTDHVKSAVSKKVDSFVTSSEFTNTMQNICKTELSHLLKPLINTVDTEQKMMKKIDEILPAILNQDFIGAYLAVVIAKAREKAEQAAKEFNNTLGIGN